MTIPAHIKRALALLKAHPVGARAHLLKAAQLLRRHKPAPAPAPAGPTVMFDSINLDQIPADAPAVAGYVGGNWPTYAQLAKRFPKARRLSIAVASSQDAECLDVEPGDATNDTAPRWVQRQLARGVKKPVVYTSASNVKALLASLAVHGIQRSEIRLWTAHYTFHPHVCGPQCGFGIATTADATQWTDKALGRNLDQSLCARSFWL